MDQAGDNAGHPLDMARYVRVDDQGNVYVTGMRSNNLFRVDVATSGAEAPKSAK
jgi:hypothetical protein